MTRISAAPEGIAKRYLHDEVADRLRTLIIDGDLPPLARVNELELAERFGISRTPLREAIKILATEGLLELLPNRGARVVAIGEQELEDMLEVVAGLEATAAELACRHITADELTAIRAQHADMEAAWTAGDETAYFALNSAIHDCIMAAARNPTLTMIYANVSGRIQRARFTAHKTPAQWEKAVAEHRGMLELLAARDGEALARLMRAHVRGKKPVISASFG
jgi:DNA-binding GntR family transcriptional regulator